MSKSNVDYLRKKPEKKKSKKFLGKVVVFCEGHTEENYFASLKNLLEDNRNKFATIEVEPINLKGGNLKTLFSKVKDKLTNTSKYVHYTKYLIADCDCDKDCLLRNILKIEKSEYDVNLLISKEVFEIWLLMHFMKVSVDSYYSKRKTYEEIREYLQLITYNNHKNDSWIVEEAIKGSNNLISAIENAEILERNALSNSQNILYDILQIDHNITNVHHLVKEVYEEIKELLN